uniref:G-protein coupled receptors family 1 profile domain-containing protein n=2 Tax=Clytia hemisphaerica TaxID=252671 RepID=A0A7M5XCD0_9CNID
AINFKKVAIINLTIWCVTICFGAVALTTGLSSRIGDAITVCFTVFMYLLTITTNVKIYGEVKRHTENLKRNCIEDGVGSKDNKGLNIPHGELTLESTSGNKTISPKRKFIHDPKSTVDQLLSVSNTANDTAQSSQNTFSKLALESPNELTVPVLATITPICEYSDNKITKKQNENCNSKLKPSDVSTEPSEKLIIQALTTKTSNSATKHQDNALELRNQQLFTTRPNELIIQKAHSSSVCEARPQNISSRPVLSKKKTRQYLDARCIRSAKMCSVIVITFACCWTPHALHDLLKITNAAPSIVYSDSILARTTLVVAFLNGIIDPILYVTMNKSLKKQIGKFKRRILNTVS